MPFVFLSPPWKSRSQLEMHQTLKIHSRHWTFESTSQPLSHFIPGLPSSPPIPTLIHPPSTSSFIIYPFTLTNTHILSCLPPLCALQRGDCLKNQCYDIVKKALRNLERFWLQDSEMRGKVEGAGGGWMDGLGVGGHLENERCRDNKESIHMFYVFKSCSVSLEWFAETMMEGRHATWTRVLFSRWQRKWGMQESGSSSLTGLNMGLCVRDTGSLQRLQKEKLSGRKAGSGCLCKPVHSKDGPFHLHWASWLLVQAGVRCGWCQHVEGWNAAWADRTGRVCSFFLPGSTLTWKIHLVVLLLQMLTVTNISASSAWWCSNNTDWPLNFAADDIYISALLFTLDLKNVKLPCLVNIFILLNLFHDLLHYSYRFWCVLLGLYDKQHRTVHHSEINQLRQVLVH